MTEQPDEQPPAPEGLHEGVKLSAGDSGGSSGRTRLWRRTAGAAAVVAVLVVGNTTVNSAAASPASRSTGATASTMTARTRTAGTPTASTRTTGGNTDVSSAALHGEFRVINRDGSAQLRRWQSGAVNAIDHVSLTVRSADGFDSTYLLGPGVSVTGIGLGDEVTVVGAGQAVPGND